MSAQSTRRRRRGQHDSPEHSQGAPMTLTSREFIGKLLSEYRENNKNANVAHEEAQRAFADAARFEQQAADLGAKEQAALARVQQAQAEFKQVQAERQEASTYAEKAREYGTAQMANHEGFTGQATDAKTVLDRFEIDVPADAEYMAQALPPAVPPTSPMPVVGEADPTADDPRMDGPLSRFNNAHDDEDKAESAGAS